MSYYTLDKNNQIYGDYVKRLGAVLRDYNGKYEVTLAVNTLQSLLTVLTESKLYSRKNVIDSLYFAEEIQQLKLISNKVTNRKILGISKSSIIESTYYTSLTIKEILSFIRHALSHPVSGKDKSDIPKTGFYSIQNKTIEKIVFANSPDGDGFKINFNRFEERKEKLGFPPKAICNNRQVLVDGKPYYRYIKIEFTPDQLKQLVLDLSDLFSKFIIDAKNPENTLRMLSKKFAA